MSGQLGHVSHGLLLKPKSGDVVMVFETGELGIVQEDSYMPRVELHSGGSYTFSSESIRPLIRDGRFLSVLAVYG